MATAYKEINSSTPVVLNGTARADGIDIHANHPLRSCMRWQWFFDDLLGNGATEIAGATNETYTVDLSDVANSGEYYCEIQIGNSGVCDQVTRRERISIVECLDQSTRSFGPSGGSGQLRVRAPHYETVTFSAEGNDWINPSGLITCDTQSANVCLFVQNFTVPNTGVDNSARRGQPTIRVGEFICFYNLLQGYRDEAPDPVEPDEPAGPFINLSSDGPVLAGSLFGNITVTADVGTIGGTGTETYTVAWTGATDVPNPSPRAFTATVANPNAAATRTVTATVTDNNGMTASASIDVEFIMPIVQTTTAIGDTLLTVQWRVLQSLGAGGLVSGPRRVTGTFETGGVGNWNASLNWYNGFAGAAATAGVAEASISGPGVNETLRVTPDSTSDTFEATERLGTYTITLSMRSVQPDLSTALANILISPRQF